ncbi:type II toxin-antitoxin system prevent-host-death family antitoxin [Leptothermofonsia sichuanensis E412]|uniref:type II toxin-antitoxin system Phd/YefM family antitoxin n=1 Tax=Leptothermofonsia sichuanensis TaxID=2917832 RepID=UPI001CA7943F|nr:type II toxin-antitoxin system prevent-host-death family antitoxin [Leptothermofonsia sichuanensis]QZZ21424.1 type II toxin-antitoxin system prevent-host-death family antitoxin [Leptothermofonsia sichuanensis E412]
MHQVDITDAQTQITQLLESALQGKEVIITRNNQPILKLIQIPPATKRRQRGSAKGQIWMAPDFDAPLEDFKEYMERTYFWIRIPFFGSLTIVPN